MTDIIQALERTLETGDILVGNDVSEKYQHDWSAETPFSPIAVVRPSSTKELSEILTLCSEHKQKVVVQGGLTGLCGGATPRKDELAISLEKMSGIEALDKTAMTMTVKAGTPLQTIQEAADAADFIFPLDLGARGTCNIGGNISTNAGGNQVLRFGMTRNLVLGLEAVLADGSVISSMNKMLKNNAGYDLKQLFIGTEGTLGVVSRAVLRLYPKAKSRCSALLGLNSFEDVIKLKELLSQNLGVNLSAFEVMWASYYEYIEQHISQITSPLAQSHAFYVLTEMEGADAQLDQECFDNVLGGAMESGIVADGVIAYSERDRERFWQIRDGVGEIGDFISGSANFDVSIPISSMRAFLDELDQALNDTFTSLTKLVFGHVADSNLHIICVTGDKKDIKAIYAIVYRIVGSYAGSVSAEHGIGVQKLNYLHYSRSPEELQLMRVLKQAMDPHGLLNEGRVLPSV